MYIYIYIYVCMCTYLLIYLFKPLLFTFSSFDVANLPPLSAPPPLSQRHNPFYPSFFFQVA